VAVKSLGYARRFVRALDLYAKNSRVATLLDGTRVPVSREGHARLQELLGEG
jgi:hypothetical protein